MRQGLTGIALLGLVLAGCGGGDKKSEPPESTGVLHSKIQGVGYRTSTRSGKTDANGTFKYLPGETVSFSVGGIELGSAPGASTVSLFTLAGMTPPTSERALRRELMRMRYTTTPLSQAASRAWLLLALDSDGNPDNGIDVSAHESALATAKLSFDARLYEFPAKLARLAPGLNKDIPHAFPVKWLYRSLGVIIAANAPSGQRDDYDGDGVMDAVLTTQVDAAGEIGTTNVDLNGDQQADQVVTYTRDSLGRFIRRRALDDMNLDGVIDRDRTTITTYDVHGNATGVVDWDDAGADGGIDSESIGVSTFDAHGRLLQSTYTLDFDYDGTLDSREVHTYTYDARGNLLRLLVELDFEADGSVNARYVTDNTWDANDRQLSSKYDRDFEADGHVDSSRRSASTYGATQYPGTFVEEYDSDGDGIYEQRVDATHTYDAAGNVVRSVANYAAHYDGWEDAYQYVQDATFDRDRRPLSRTLSYDFDIDGVVESYDVETNTYDADGFPLTWEYTSNYFGTDDWVQHVDYGYTPEGAQKSMIAGTDFDGDGTQEIFQTSEIDYTPTNNALPLIITQYLGF